MAQGAVKLQAGTYEMDGTGLDTPFLQRCVSLLKQLRLPFYIDAAGSKEGELARD